MLVGLPLAYSESIFNGGFSCILFFSDFWSSANKTGSWEVRKYLHVILPIDEITNGIGQILQVFNWNVEKRGIIYQI